MKNIGFLVFIAIILTACSQSYGRDCERMDSSYYPAGWEFEKPETILVLGNSICQIPGEWGMSASSAEKDYVHLLAGKIGCSFTARNSWDIEQAYETYDFSALPDADMVIIQLGDNMATHYTGYSEYLEKLIVRYNGKTVVLISTILDNNKLAPVDSEIQKAARVCGVPYIDIRDIMQDETNIGILYHPNDKGMAIIAENIYSALIQHERN